MQFLIFSLFIGCNYIPFFISHKMCQKHLFPLVSFFCWKIFSFFFKNSVAFFSSFYFHNFHVEELVPYQSHIHSHLHYTFIKNVLLIFFRINPFIIIISYLFYFGSRINAITAFVRTRTSGS